VPVRRSRGRDESARADADRPPLTLRHPKRTLATAIAILAALVVLGLNVEDRLTPTTLDIPGTRASRANEMLREHFGDSQPFAILLRGPAAAIDRQGPALVRALRRDPNVSTLSPWDRGSVDRLRPSPRKALILANFHVGITEAVNETVPELNRTLEEQISPPVRVIQSGYPTLSRQLQERSISASERAELIALPILLLVLLLVFRSPVAATIPLVFGAITVLSSRGVLVLFTSWLDIDAFALTVCTMMGLALGVDYALLMVSRFREELAGGADPVDAAWTTRRTAGRTTAFAGSTLLLSMLVSLFILPGSLLASLAETVAMVVVLSVLVSTMVAPALLILVGSNLDRWRIGPAANGGSKLMAFVNAALRRPAPVAAVIGGVLLVLAGPALALKTGPPSPEQLPPDDPVRQDVELIDSAFGSGWDAPFVLVATTPHGSITDAKSLAAISRWQRRIAADPGVRAVIGPAQVAHRVAPLQKTGNAVLASNGEFGPLSQLKKLGSNLDRAADGVAQLREGLSEATAGAGLIATGSDQAGAGALSISRGLALASSGSRRAVGALDTFAEGTRKLSQAQHRAALGALALKLGTHDLIPSLRHNALVRSRKEQKSLGKDVNATLPTLEGAAQVAEQQLKAALQRLDQMTVGQGDPEYAGALAAVRQATAAVSGTDPATGLPYGPGYTGLPAELAALKARLADDLEQTKQITGWLITGIIELKRLSSIAVRLSDGLEKIARGGNKLKTGSARLASQAKGLETGLTRLATGAISLVGGLSQLGDGASELERNLAVGFQQSYPLQSGLRRATVRVIANDAKLQRRIGGVRRASPGLFDSGYFVLSALEGAPPAAREAAGTTIDLRNGGQAASMLIVSRYGFNTDGSIALNRKLDEDAEKLAGEADLSTGVAGGAAQLNEYSSVTQARFPWVVVAITLVTFLVLVVVLRALLLAAVAVALNLATVGVAFGVLTLLGLVPDDFPLGGHSYIDAVGATMIFGLVFGLSIDYAVFLLVRMREHYEEHGDNAAAVRFGLEKTARVITGAAAIMMAVFIAFAGAPVATVSQLGVGLTIAVLLDATVIRIVLLPALMLLLGDRVWWLPRPLERVLPRLNV
jgi:putative drug exporter of the RND superfamily